MEEEKQDTTLWMVTFSDLVMLLLTFFVLLLSMSSLNKKKLKEFFSHFQGSTGVLEFSGSRGITDLAYFIKKYHDTEGMIVIDQNLLKTMLKLRPNEIPSNIFKNLNRLMEIRDNQRGIVISFQDKLLFDPGKAVIRPDVYPVLDKIAEAIKKSTNTIMIMGHTDNIPIKSGIYKSNWELSVYRALSVLDYFINEKHISPSRFEVGGYGSSLPLYPNNTPERRAKNRRVEIIFRHLS